VSEEVYSPVDAGMLAPTVPSSADHLSQYRTSAVDADDLARHKSCLGQVG
jgi:hypothetical protein